MTEPGGEPLRRLQASKSRGSLRDRAREAAPLVPAVRTSVPATRRITRASAKKKGSLWEKQVVDYLKENGWPQAERRVKQGRNDRGDVAGFPGIIECKNTSTLDLAQAMNEAKREAAAAMEPTYAVFMRRRQKSVMESYAVTTIDQYVYLVERAGFPVSPRGTSEGV